MTTQNFPSHDLLSLTVLALLFEQPRYPYEIQRLIRDRHKDFALSNIRSLYHSVDRLLKQGLIEVDKASREGNRPEHTSFRLTEVGRQEFLIWLETLISSPLPESPSFTAAVSFLGYLSPQQALTALQNRAVFLEGEIAKMDAVLRMLSDRLQPILLLEGDYTRTLCKAELDWVTRLIAAVQTGKITWDSCSMIWKPDPKERSGDMNEQI